MKLHTLMLLTAVAASLSFSACGGGSTTTPPPATYTIGGTISGLYGTGLVLQDNATDNLAISGNGSFTFTTSITSGGTYKVTVSTPPSGQTCTVSNSSGTASANVTNVQVACAAIATYTIGGTVSGLSGAGLVLQDNGGDNLAINGNGSFTFVTAIDSGETYNVTVYDPPLSPLQVCLVSSGSGTANANVTNVAVTCSTPTEQTLYMFGSAPDGNGPFGSLVFDSSGNLYGTTGGGGAYGHGTVFELSPGAGGQWTEKILYSFCPQTGCVDGDSPNGGLIFDAAGNLYGTALYGGAYASKSGTGSSGYGVAFELTPQSNGSWAETVLHSFGNGTDGTFPVAALVLDSMGNLYGTTSDGGASGPCYTGCGTAFELMPGADSQWTETILYNFCSQAGCADGNLPEGSLIVDANGNLYGTTYFSGASASSAGNGTVFELSPGKDGQWTRTTLCAFQQTNYLYGNPIGALIQDKAGNLYGAAYWLGGGGGVYSLTHGSGSTWSENVLYVFCWQAGCRPDGNGPTTGLVLDKAGNLYGTTAHGNYFSNGTVFELTPGSNGTWTEAVLYGSGVYGGQSGPIPTSSLIMDGAGNLYGVAALGHGIAYEVAP